MRIGIKGDHFSAKKWHMAIPISSLYYHMPLEWLQYGPKEYLKAAVLLLTIIGAIAHPIEGAARPRTAARV
ncbi:hypothetical protein [Collinsella tanakaei]|uniref:hypothetical protein n=1 Tax=Collinsella tanakaei TaxID=626935 RepID=UPI0026F0CE76|nr:hypothetical protein [Collinsella tanakaei]